MPQQLDLDLEVPKKLDPKEERRKLEAEYKTAVGATPPFSLTNDELRTATINPDAEIVRLRLEELKEPNTNFPFTLRQR